MNTPVVKDTYLAQERPQNLYILLVRFLRGGVLPISIFCLVATAFASAPKAQIQSADNRPSSEAIVVTLGTAGGPRPRVDRHQLANLLIVNGTPYLIDAGDGVVGQINRAGFDFRKIGHIFITHNHSDHTMGLPALLATQWEFQRRDPVTIHGPLGTAKLMKGAMAFLAVNSEIRSAEGFPSSLSALVKTNESEPGVIYRDDNVTVTAAENAHYNFPRESAPYGRHKSFAYRFDTAERSIVFSGDTGPSKGLAKLAHGADILVTEVSDVDELMQLYKQNGIWDNKTPEERQQWLFHQRNEHMSPAQVAELAISAGIKTIILTHFPPAGGKDDDFARRVEQVKAAGFDGEVFAAHDLDRF